MTDGSAALVTPFKGERYRDLERSGDLIAPPYDVISTEQRRIYRERSEHNIIRLILPAGNGNRYGHAATILESWRSQGVLVQDREPAVYVLRQEFETPGGETKVRTGVIAAVAVESYSQGRIRPHERTHRGPKEDRLALMQSTRAMFEALLLMCRDRSGVLQELLLSVAAGDSDFEAVLDGVTISLWSVPGPAGEAIASAAGDDGALYIADGHHRYETAQIYHAENSTADRTLGLIVPLGDPGLTILPTHRIIHGSPIDRSAVVDLLGERFEPTDLASAGDVEVYLGRTEERLRCVVYLPGPTFLGLQVKEGVDLSWLPFADEPTVLALDVAKIDSLVVDPLRSVGVSPCKISYGPSTKGVIQRVYSEGASAAVLMRPTGVEQVLAVADAGAFMPQKSTYFAPKVPSGLVVLRW